MLGDELGSTYWVAVQELELSYNAKETLFLAEAQNILT